MILKELNCNNIIFEEVSNDSNCISVITRPIFELEIDENFSSIVYTSSDIKTILTSKVNKILGKFIVTVPYSQWTETIKIQEQEYRLAGIDLGTVSLHFMILIENLNKNEVYLYTGDFFTIDKLNLNEFFKEHLPKIKKIFYDNKTVKYDLNTYMDIISTFIKQKINEYSFSIYLPHLGYEDFLAALIKNFNMTVHVNELRKLVLQKSLSSSAPNATFVNKDGKQPNLIVHRKSKSLTEIKKLYYKYKICTLSFSHFKEFSTDTPKIVDYYLTILEWDQHPTELMLLKLFQMLPEHTEFYLIHEDLQIPQNIINYIMSKNIFVDSCDLDDNMLSLELTNLNEDYESSQIDHTQQTEFAPSCFSTQLNQNNIPIDVNHIIESNDCESESSNSQEPEDFCIEDYRNLDLGSDFYCLRLIERDLDKNI